MKLTVITRLSHTFVIIFAAFSSVFAQAGDQASASYRFLIDMPSTGVVPKGYVTVGNELLPGGVLLSRLDVGVFDGVSFGVSYGGLNVIGAGDVEWYKYPGVNLRVNLFKEGLSMPALTIGFDSQGKGRFFRGDDRYEIKSPGFFGSVSKNYGFLGYMSLHGTINYSIEQKEGDNFVNAMIGFEKTIGPKVSLMCDYNFGFNDNTAAYGRGNGYLNVGLRWSVTPELTLGFDFRDLLNNKKWSPSTADRALRIDFMQKIN